MILYTKHYLELEKVRFEDRWRICFETPVTQFSLPCLTLQPIVENAVRYGFMSKKEGGMVLIQTMEEEDAYIIKIQDDGVGLEGAPEDKTRRTHVGIVNVRDSLAAQCGGTLSIHSIDAKGTTVILRIPKEKC